MEGYLLYDPGEINRFIFRTYIDGISKDYRLNVEDLKIKIIDNYITIKEEKDMRYIVYKNSERNIVHPVINKL